MSTYFIKDKKFIKDNKFVNFIALGCGGTANDNQIAVANHLYDTIYHMSPNQRPAFIALLGDNIYESGAESADDFAFNTCFHDIYDKITLEFNIPFFVILGNHGYNLHRFSFFSTDKSRRARAMNQVNHSYLQKDYPLKKGKSSSITLSSMPSWNMPSNYYKVSFPEQDFYFLDSNTLSTDWLAQQVESKVENQITWLREELIKSRNNHTEITIFQHHALQTLGKRADPFGNTDLGMYMPNKSDRLELRRRLNITRELNFHEILMAIFTVEKFIQINYKINIFCAHDHNQSVYRSIWFNQMTAGGAGGDLQTKFYAPYHDIMNSTSLFTPKHGYMIKYSKESLAPQNRRVDKEEKQEQRTFDLEVVESTTGRRYYFTDGQTCSNNIIYNRKAQALVIACKRYLVFVSKLRYGFSHSWSDVTKTFIILNTLLSHTRIKPSYIPSIIQSAEKIVAGWHNKDNLSKYICNEINLFNAIKNTVISEVTSSRSSSLEPNELCRSHSWPRL